MNKVILITGASSGIGKAIGEYLSEKGFIVFGTSRNLVTSRVGQGAYRKRIIHRWEYKCAVNGFDKLNILIASHIVPWSDSNDIERLDVDNAIIVPKLRCII